MLTLTSREPNIMAFYSILLAFEQILKSAEKRSYINTKFWNLNIL